MKFRGYLLGAAGVLAGFAGPAIAADYTEAEPVDYVRVCEAFGTGYFYIPGTETCMRMPGYVRFDTLFDDSKDWHYDFRIRTRLNFDVRSKTDLGTLQGFVRLQGDQVAPDGDKSQDNLVKVERAYITLGNWFVGTDNSFFDYSNGDGGYTLERRGFRSDTVNDHVGYRYAPKTGLGAFVSLEDPRTTGMNYWPDVVGGFTYTADAFDMKVSAAGANEFTGYAVAGAGTVKLDSIAKGDAFRLVASYADDASASFTGVGGSRGFVSSSYAGESWSLLGSFRHYFKPEFVVAVTGTYGEATETSNGIERGWEGIFSANYSPAKGLWMGPELSYLYDDNGSKDDFSRWLAMLRVVRDW
jgi:hypothetical protein